MKTWQIGLLAGLIGAGYGFYVQRLATGEGYEWFPVYAGLAAFVTTTFFWWLVVTRSDKRSVWRGIIAGALSGSVAHYICWYLQIIGTNLCYWFSGGCVSSLGEPPVDLLNGLWAALVLSLASLLFFGWLTVPTGALVGGLLGYRRS